MEKIWLNSYETGVAAEVALDRYQSIPDMFQHSTQKYAALTAFHNMGRDLSFNELNERAEHFASYLQNILKLKKGDRVAIMMPNILQYPIAVFGILKAGLIVVNTNPLYTPRELEHQLNDSGASTIIVLENFANTLELVLPKTQVKNIVIASIGDMFGPLKGTIMNFVLRKIKKMVPNYRIPQAIGFLSALKQGAAHPFQPVEINQKDLAFLQYTGGTTGLSKGAMLSHGNILANMSQGAEWIKNKLIPGKEVVVAALPLYHILSLTINMMIFLENGGKCILITNPRDIPGFIKELGKHRFTVFIGLNTLFNALLNRPEFHRLDFSSWHLTLGGGSATQKAVADKWQEVTGLPIVDAYGLTEASPGVCVNPLNITQYSGTIGLPIPNTDIEIRDGQGNVLPIGETGELWIKGPQVMQGYWQRPEETAKVFDERGFLETGDIVSMDEKGWLRVIDRKKDMIIVSGFNVYPNEVEEVVTQHPKVLEVACIGVPSDKTGEAVKLFVVKKDASLSKEELQNFCRENMTAYKIPREIEFRDELPKSNIGKILRRELRN